jgi:hypothetical protein
MPFLDEIRARFVAQGAGTFGVDIFIGSGSVVPAGDGPYISLVETGGTSASKTQNDTGTERPSAQIVARATNPVLARAKLKLAYDALGGVNDLYNVTLSGTFYVSVTKRQGITDVGMDQTGKRTMYAFNIDCEKYPS